MIITNLIKNEEDYKEIAKKENLDKINNHDYEQEINNRDDKINYLESNLVGFENEIYKLNIKNNELNELNIVIYIDNNKFTL